MKRLSTFGSGIVALILLVFAVGTISRAADSFDIIPAAGGNAHWHITRTTQTMDGNDTAMNDVHLGRTGDLDATLARDAVSVTLNVLPDGSLQSNAALDNPDLGNFLAVLNLAHTITTGPGSGSSNGWTALVSTAEPANSQSEATPAPALTLPIHATMNGSTLTFTGEGETNVTPGDFNPGNNPGQPGGHHGGGHYGGGQPGDDQNPARRPLSATLKLKVSGVAIHGVVTKLSITEIRGIVFGSRQFLNTETWTIVSV